MREKPCPFCGCEMCSYNKSPTKNGALFWIECDACGARTRPIFSNDPEECDGSIALHAWNHRVSDIQESISTTATRLADVAFFLMDTLRRDRYHDDG